MPWLCHSPYGRWCRCVTSSKWMKCQWRVSKLLLSECRIWCLFVRTVSMKTDAERRGTETTSNDIIIIIHGSASTLAFSMQFFSLVCRLPFDDLIGSHRCCCARWNEYTDVQHTYIVEFQLKSIELGVENIQHKLHLFVLQIVVDAGNFCNFQNRTNAITNLLLNLLDERSQQCRVKSEIITESRNGTAREKNP